MLNKLALLLIVFSFLSCHTYKHLNHDTLNTIPFTLTDHNNISIEAVINQKDTVNLMFHTAANSLDLTKQASQKTSSIQWDNEVEVNTWGGSASSTTSNNNTLAINGRIWDSLTIWQNENSGPTTDGKFGPNLFAGKVIAIDYDKSEITLHQSIPEYSKEYLKLPLSFENDMMFIESVSTVGEDHYTNRFLIHSGFGGTILYDDAFANESKLGQRISISSQQELKDSHGNTLITKKGEIPLFTIGNFEFKNMPVGFFEGSIGRQKISVLGGDVLKRFNIIIDSDRTFIYLKPNDFFDVGFSG